MSFYQLCYASRSTAPCSPSELSNILGTSRRNNRARNISGLLLYHNQSFIQLLEGEKASVNDLYRRIQLDPRHDNTRILFESTIPERSFGEWDMGFCATSGLKDLPGYANFFSPDFSIKDFHRGDRARLVFTQFRDGLWRQHIDMPTFDVGIRPAF